MQDRQYKIKKMIKLLTPPVLPLLLRPLYCGTPFSGNYATWGDAKKHSTGYDSDVILRKVRDSLLQVKKGLAVHETDSMLFDRIKYSWPLLTALMWCASQGGNKLSLIDFGGSLGTTYFQNRKFLKDLKELHWNIVEQRNFVECGKKYFEDEHLKFYDDIDSCCEAQLPNVIIFSGVLQYLEDPYGMLGEIFRYPFEYILVDRTLFFTDNTPDRITIQNVPPAHYEASFPAWFFNLEKFLKYFKGRYDMIEDFDSNDGIINLEGREAVHKGFIFRLRKPESSCMRSEKETIC